MILYHIFINLRLKRPARLILKRNEDILITGGRHPALGNWKVGFDKDGRIVALQVNMYLNAGYSQDASPMIAYKAILHMDNVYQKVFLYF